MAEYGQNSDFSSCDDGEEFFQVVKKKPSGSSLPAPESCCPPAAEVPGDEEIVQVVKSQKAPAVKPPETVLPASNATPVSAVMVQQPDESVAGEVFHDLDEDGDVELKIKRRVASPLVEAESPAAQRLNRRPSMPTAEDALMKPKNYFFGCFSFVLVSAGLILGSVWFCSKNWSAIRGTLNKFDQWMVDHSLAKRPEPPKYEKIQDEIRAELLADNLGTGEDQNIPRVKSAKDAVRHFKNYASICDMMDQP